MKHEITTQFSSAIAEPQARKRKLSLTSILCSALALAWAGCTTSDTLTGNTEYGKTSMEEVAAGHDTFGRNWAPTPAPAPKPAPPAPAPTPVPAIQTTCSDPIKSGIVHLSKKVPPSVRLGEEYVTELDYDAVVCATNIVITDYVPAGATYIRSEAPANVDGNKLTWNIGAMDAGETRIIKVWLRADQEGVLASCATIKADPRVCAETRVLKAAIELTKSEPAEELICDPIPVKITVKNTGSTALSGVQIADSFPTGMTSDGKSSLNFDVGSLAPGESKDVKYSAAAASTGKFQNNAKVTCTEGVTAEASATTTVHQPVLTITCQAPEEQFMGRKFDVSYTVGNTGDAAAAGSSLVITVPAGLTVSASGNGQVKEGSITYDLGSIEPSASQKVSATFTSATPGSFQLAGSTKGICAQVASASCTTKVNGIPAILLEKSDDPDPVAIGDTTTYTVKVTNQGTADDSNVQVVVTIAPELVPVSTSDGTISEQTVTLPVVPTLAAKQAVTYKIIAKGVKAGDGHTKFTLSSNMLKSPITAEESTTVY
jgi:uncharacterized repeat protein (TIGR01451 family)